MKKNAVSRQRIWFVSPVLFDVESYLQLRHDLLNVLAEHRGEIDFNPQFVVVDDSGGSDPRIDHLRKECLARVIEAPFPLGHQRAIVYGLRELAGQIEREDIVVTLDADGEDQPADVPRLLAPLLEAFSTRDRRVALALRTRRRESLAFKVLYLFFKILFFSLTGRVVRSGNFAAYRGWLPRNVVFHPHFDLCYSSSLLSLSFPIDLVPCERGRRYAGRSRMTTLKLITHGLRMLVPFADRIAIRGLLASATLFAMGLLLSGWVIGIKLFTDRSIPGWATYTLSIAVVLCGIAIASLILVFTLFTQSQSLSMRRLDAIARPEGVSDVRDSLRKSG